MKNQKETEESLWQQALTNIEKKTAQTSFNTWIKRLEFISIDYENSLIYFSSFSEMAKGLVEDRYRSLIEKNIEEVFGRHLTLIAVLHPDEVPSHNKKQTTRSNKTDIYSDDNNLNPKYTFDSFVVGDGNSVANALSIAVAENPGTSYNPLFIYGGSGLGKTHLMHAIGHQVLQKNPDTKVLYVSSETFTNQFIDAIKDKTMVHFRNKYRYIDILMVDDIQFLENKEKVQEEFFHTFNSLYENGKQIVLTSDKPPKEIKTLEERLRTRFDWGLSADIQVPDYETRVAILKKKAEQVHIQVNDDIEKVLEQIAEKMQSNVRELEGALNRLIVFSSSEGVEINLHIAKKVLKDIFNSQNKEITADLIKQIVCKHFNIKISDIESTSRSQNLVVPRQIAMYLCKELIGNLSFPKIAEEFRKKDHSTVMHACKKVNQEMLTDTNFRETVDSLINQIHNY